ncbi:MAG TPA: hypothetical protein VL547_03360 [Dinghuibacter sp.]|uniref:hypothetical protein n=1 Tax=Dinghuibacter sp. TaxID=2024697 RepID=UPI002BE5801D|nr:hypothetical protein [Dinghuibacter sp.]HTJ11029.1 hypothetical protein [Dinghuibacter sp.]
MKKIELNHEKLKLRKEKVVSLTKTQATTAPSLAHPTTTVLHTYYDCRGNGR